MESLTDEELMILVANGNIDMARHLFDRYHVRIYNYLLGMTKNREVSRDITQEVFYKLIKYRGSYGKTRFSSWIYTIARNLCNDHFQNLKNKDYSWDEVEFRAGKPDSNTIEQKENTEQLNRALNMLNKQERELILMSRFQKMRYQEIAEITGLSIAAVKTRIHRAMHKLRTYYFQNIEL
ncbi:sigma-70 family RNA polymerase sigma factor [Leptobacterium flavescens]|uniref:Sigma-70 family RNA polymerase sigma factor n=1 Tax=Leptobacterium flavescens TaxID=472055 RepID=A0A6P0ULY9_9FLAO|nr:RNA polymerase sigma factor [Leptobacterium flavescens]NER14361.1 sigma-70 family RNA polymerase sigma factor [Leptobacterium flavescens]